MTIDRSRPAARMFLQHAASAARRCDRSGDNGLAFPRPAWPRFRHDADRDLPALRPPPAGAAASELVIRTILTLPNPRAGQGVNDDLAGRAKSLARGRLAVAAEGHVVQPPQFGRRAIQRRPIENLSADRQVQHLLQFAAQNIQVHIPGRPWPGSIDIAINAIEVALLVGVEIDPDRQPPAAPADDRIDIPVLPPVAAGAA